MIRKSFGLLLFLVLGCGGRPAVVTRQDCQGGRVWHDDDALRFTGCQRVVGDLDLGGALTTTEAFVNLRKVDGSLTIGPSYQLANLSGLARLTTIGKDLLVTNTQSVLGLYLPSLVEVGGSLKIRGNLSITSVSLHSVVKIGVALEVIANRNLERLDLSSLVVVLGKTEIHGRNLEEIVTPDQIEWQKTATKPAMPTRVY